MLVLTVIDGMHELMQQGVEDLNAIAERWGDKDLIYLVRRGFGAPTLPDMPTFDVRAGKATGNVAVGDEVTFGAKDWLEGADGLLQPLFAGDGGGFWHSSGRIFWRG